MHLHPSKDFQCPFLEVAFDSVPTPGSMLAECAALDAYNCAEVAKKWFVLLTHNLFFWYNYLYLQLNRKVPYSYLRLQVKPLPEEVKSAVAEYAPLDTLI